MITVAPSPAVPREVTLCAIAHKVTVGDGMVMFTSRFGPLVNRLIFERRCGCWYVSSDRAVMTAHVREAQRLIDKWFGDDHHVPRGENNP